MTSHEILALERDGGAIYVDCSCGWEAAAVTVEGAEAKWSAHCQEESDTVSRRIRTVLIQAMEETAMPAATARRHVIPLIEQVARAADVDLGYYLTRYKWSAGAYDDRPPDAPDGWALINGKFYDPQDLTFLGLSLEMDPRNGTSVVTVP